ncbi:hypothetical protein [Pseudomonas syringae group genomosp. 3]|uniref:hypothetical protein n=1 Tax=Pseudomonas syringae group genomosp. 3 TaxID=251701 RepID=UPI0015E41A69|nr:hypothetical protein [Pseudomonas syringae group genomosp. 3]
MSVTRVQKTFSELEYTGKKKQTRRDRFLADLEQGSLRLQIARSCDRVAAGTWI